MKQTSRFLAFFLCIVLLTSAVFTVDTHAADLSVFDTSNASEGYFTVHFDATVKMKVGVTVNSKTTYYSYTPGTYSSYAFTEGNGSYKLTLYRNVYGTSYAKVTSKTVNVNLVDALAPYRASTAEITFSQNDAVGLKAAEICQGLTDDAAKVVAIHNYVASNFTYDYNFAASVRSGAMKGYVPNTSNIIASGKGVCYDFAAVFAALCRSQGIACTLQKGYLNGQYHAWNVVYVNNGWVSVDLTASISYGVRSTSSIYDCAAVMYSNTYTY
ncbi:MAG: transglutaminase-like domain-containing protein [Eubacteriales bacterium]|nr:transglutaminase-like domain-containing protein [Eubacteriales bacterium]